jgi:hypothetical protein
MPLRFAISSGNWSNAAIWSGSLFPTASDDVFLNNQTVTLDQNIVVQSLRNTATGSAVAGGLLNIFSDYNITVTTNGINSDGSNSRFIRYHNTGSITITSIFLQTKNSLENVGSGTINIVGEIRFPGVGLVNIGRTILNSSNGTINIIGNITCPANSLANNLAILNSANGTINVTGNVVGGSAGSSGGNIGISNSSTGTIIITGSVLAGVAGVGISSGTAGIIIVSGSTISSPNNPGISSTSTSATVRVSGPLIASQNNINPIFSPRIQLISTSTPTYTLQSDTFNKNITFYDTSFTSSLPSQTNVRSGSLYGGLNEFSGSMIIPPTSSVRYGVPVDNVTGSVTLTPQDILNYAVSSLTGSNTIGARLQNIATVQTTTATIAAFKGK